LGSSALDRTSDFTRVWRQEKGADVRVSTSAPDDLLDERFNSRFV